MRLWRRRLGSSRADETRSRLLFSSQLTPLTSSATASTSTLRDSNTYQQFRMVDERISEGVKEVMRELPDEASQGELRSEEASERS